MTTRDLVFSHARPQSLRRPLFRNIFSAPLHDFPIRDELLIQYAPLLPGMRVLEVGPGSGYTAFWMARFASQVTLVDVAKASMDHLRDVLGRVRNIQFLHADATAPGLSRKLDSQFDLAFALDVLEHLPNPSGFFRNMAEALSSNGSLFVTFPNPNPPTPDMPGSGHGVNSYVNLEQLQRELTSAGFSRQEISVVRLRPFAQTVYNWLHNRPLAIHRRWLRHKTDSHSQIYDGSWAFQTRRSLNRYKPFIHGAWATLSAILHLGGDLYVIEPAKHNICDQRLLIRARR